MEEQHKTITEITKEAFGDSNKIKYQEHDFVGAGIFSHCRKCGEFILNLGIPQKPCNPNKKVK